MEQIQSEGQIFTSIKGGKKGNSKNGNCILAVIVSVFRFFGWGGAKRDEHSKFFCTFTGPEDSYEFHRYLK